MKGLLLLAALGLLGYYGYLQWFAKESVVPPAPAPAPVIKAKPEPVDFAVKSRVRRLLEEWKRRSLSSGGSEVGSASVDPGRELTEIRRIVFSDGRHSEAAIRETISRALRELGVAEGEVNEVAGGILGMR
jgi:hypothetical protein